MGKLTRAFKKGVKVGRRKKFGRKQSVKLIKRVVKSMAERKTVRFNLTGGLFNIANSANTTGYDANNVLQLTPNGTNTIAQGTGQADRIGNTVRITKANLRFSVFPAPYNGSSNNIPTPQVFMMWYCKSKSATSRDQAQVATDTRANFFQTGNSTQGMQGNMFDYTTPLNNDTWTHYGRKVYKIGAANYQTNTGAQANSMSFANNDYKLNAIHTINLMKHGYPKVIDWSDGTTLPKINPLYLVMNSVDATGSANSAGTGALPLVGNMVLELEWIDL